MSEAVPAVRLLRDAATIRARCGAISAYVESGDSPHYKLDLSRIDAVAERVAAITRERFPTLKVPYHSRWRHFEAGGVDRKAELDQKLAGHSRAAVTRSHIDLTVVSVLLDAGAGPRWSYVEATTGKRYSRSEGLAVASFRAFMQGRFSSDPGDPCRVDAAALRRIDARALADIFQVSSDNPLVGLDGRALLLHRLARALTGQPHIFTADGQPGHLYDALTHHSHAPALAAAVLHHGANGRPKTVAGALASRTPLGLHPMTAAQHPTLAAARVLGALLDAFSDIWPNGPQLEGAALGDVWLHPAAGGSGPSAGWVPFHKLSQWLTYSLLEPLEWAGVRISGLDALTGLPEYRNGGLLLDGGVIVPRAADALTRRWQVGDPFIVEWRALTVALIDRVADAVRAQLGVDAAALPLASILEGGTWAAGRALAAERRDGAPPLSIDSDGTVF